MYELSWSFCYARFALDSKSYDPESYVTYSLLSVCPLCSCYVKLLTFVLSLSLFLSSLSHFCIQQCVSYRVRILCFVANTRAHSRIHLSCTHSHTQTFTCTRTHAQASTRTLTRAQVTSLFKLARARLWLRASS